MNKDTLQITKAMNFAAIKLHRFCYDDFILNNFNGTHDHAHDLHH